jgi:hypothetical protein
MQQITGADVSAAGSGVLAAATWITTMNAYLQAGATIVAILAGVTAAIWHIEKIRAARLERRNAENKDTR